MNDSIRNASKQLSNHIGFVVLRHGVKGLLDDMTPERIHAQGNDIAMNGVRNGHDLVGSAMLEASLDEEIAETIDHKWICLVDDRLYNLVLLLCGTNLQLLLQEDRSLLVVVADDLIDDVLPVTGDSLVQETTIVHRLEGGDIGLAAGCLTQIS